MIEYKEGSFVLKYTEFKNELEDGKIYSIYLFEGEDAFFRESGVSLLKSTLVSQPELNFVSLEPDCKISELLPSLEGFPFMSKRRMTVIREFYPKQDYFKSGLKEYLENPSPDSVLAIANEKSSDAFKKFSSVAVVDCSKADSSLLVRWIKAECAKADVSINGENAKLLAEYCLSDMTRIKTETDKLISFVGAGGEVSLSVIEQMVNKDTEYKIYELTDFIGKRKFKSALLVIKDMVSKGETPQRILSYVYNYFRRLLHVSISDMEIGEIAKAFGVKEFAVKKMKEQASMFKKKALKNAVDYLTESDYKIKSGLCDADDRAYLAIFKIMTEK